MSQWKKTSIASQTDSSNTDMPGHKLPDASGHIPQCAQPITTPHARQVVSPLEPVVHGDYDQDVCVCIACQTRCRNEAALHKHGVKEDHRPYGCVCGNAFGRLDVLKRHIASKNKVPKFHCPFCEHDEAAKAFARADHVVQHLRHFHKIPAGKIPQEFANMVHHDAVEDSIPPRPSMPSFPCLAPGYMTTSNFAPFDLDENMPSAQCAFQNGIPVEQQLSDSGLTGANYGSQQNAYSNPVVTFGQDAQQSGLLQPDSAGNYQVDGEFSENNIFLENPNFLLHNEFDIDFGMDFGI